MPVYKKMKIVVVCSRSAESLRKRGTTVKKCTKRGDTCAKICCCLDFKPIAFKTILLPSVQTDATLLASNSQHCWMLHVVSICTHCYMLLRVVGSFCAKFETSQMRMQTDTTCWLNNVGTLFHLLAPS